MLGSVRHDDGIASPQTLGASTQALYVQVDDLDRHFEQARRSGSQILGPPADTDLGFREYHVRDLEGHLWVFGTYLPTVDA